MTEPTVAEAKENIYASLRDDNRELDVHIAALKAAMSIAGEKTVALEVSKLAQPNRQGRKTLVAYFRSRGVDVTLV